MRTFKHPNELLGMYICPDYTTCRNFREPCMHGFPHKVQRMTVCAEGLSSPLVGEKSCTYMGRDICKLQYCRAATDEDVLDIEKFGQEYIRQGG